MKKLRSAAILAALSRAGRPRLQDFFTASEVCYPKPCFASLSRKVEGFMPNAAAAADLLPPEFRSASCSNCFSAWSMAA